MHDAAAQETGWSDLARHPLVPPLASLIAGIIVARGYDVAISYWLSSACVTLVLWLIAARRNCPRVGFTLLLCGWYFVGAAAVQSHWRMFREDDLGLRATTVPQPACVIARATSASQTRSSADEWSMNADPITRFSVSILRLRDSTTWRSASGTATVRLRGSLAKSILPGDELLIWGDLARSAPAANPGELNRAERDRGQRVLCFLRVADARCLRLRNHGGAFDPWRCVERVRNHARGLCTRYIAPSQRQLATALLLGTREQLDRDVTLAFLETGTIHVLAISGLHLGMLVWVVWFLARKGWLSRRAALWIALLLVGPYALLTGGEPPVVRAAALAICMSGGRLLSRPAQGWNLLAASALTVLCFEPLGVFQTGVQLSFLAVATLGHCTRLCARPLIQDPLERLIASSQPAWRRRIQRMIRTMLRIWGTSLMVSIITLPLIVHRFHVASPIAVFLNPFLWAPIAIALFTGFGVLMLGDLLPPVAWICGWLCGASLACAERGVLGSNAIEIGHCWMPAPATWMVLLFYSGVGCWSAFPRLRPAKWIAMSLLVGWFAAWGCFLVVQHVLLKFDRDLRITFFAVGHGTCVLVELPCGQTVLYDAGRMGNPYILANSVSNEVWLCGRFGIDLLVISHADADHFNAIGPLIQRIRVARVVGAPHVAHSRAPLLVRLRQALARQGLKIEPIDDHDRFPVTPPASIRILHPPPAEIRGTDNCNSVVLVIEYAGRRILLPGDLEAAGFARLLSQRSLTCDVVMAPHHGSVHSSPKAMVAWAQPEAIVISSKTRPDAEWLIQAQVQCAEVLDTCSNKAIRCEISEQGHTRWSRWQHGRWVPRYLRAQVPPGNVIPFGT